MQKKKLPEEAALLNYRIDNQFADPISMWSVQTATYDDMDLHSKGIYLRPGLICHGSGFENSPDAEYIAGGSSAKDAGALAIGRHGNFFHWGFAASPKYLTEEAKTVLANAIVYTSRFKGKRVIARKPGDHIQTTYDLIGKRDAVSEKARDLVNKYYQALAKQAADRKKNAQDKNDKGENLTQQKVSSYAGKYAAFALLSRVYLYMSGTFTSPDLNYAKLAEQAADSVIMNGGFTLLQATAFQNFYNISNQGNAEVIWAVNHDVAQTTLPMLLNQPAGVYAGHPSYSTGQVKPSPDLLGLLDDNDLRWNFYKVDKYRNNVTDTLSTWKYYYKYLNTGVYYSSAPFNHLRLAEIYLNRAEARIKQGNNDGALSDLNAIHTRAGHDALTGLSGQALFDAILWERRLELAFEGHIGYDYFRVGLPMVRSYPSFNSNPITIAATDPKVVMRISQDVMIENNKLTQNDQ